MSEIDAGALAKLLDALIDATEKAESHFVFRSKSADHMDAVRRRNEARAKVEAAFVALPSPPGSAQPGGYTFSVGETVEKHTGDYRLAGTIVGRLTTLSGARRYVVEHAPAAPGLLHIYAEANIRPLPAAPEAGR